MLQYSLICRNHSEVKVKVKVNVKVNVKVKV